MAYLALMVLITIIFYLLPKSSAGAFASAIFFFVALCILVALRIMRYDDIWYNGRAVAESVKTRAWRWMMKAEPYEGTDNTEVVSKQFIDDLKAILTQNQHLAGALSGRRVYRREPISDTMKKVRAMSVNDRLEVYKSDRVQNQADWYSQKSSFNRGRARFWFWVSVILNSTAVVMLLFRVRDPGLSMPIPTLATAASSVLTWLEAKKHNELTSSFSLAAHEIDLIKGEASCIESEESLSDFVIDTEAAFSREHTQWAARRRAQSCVPIGQSSR
jgi:hypothetical protein